MEKLINKLSIADFKELFVRVIHHKAFVKQVEPTFKIGSKVIDGLKALLTSYY